MEEENKEMSEQAESSGIEHFPAHEDLVVTSVEMLKKPKHRYQIAFGPYLMTVHEDVILKYRMFKGNVFRKEELEEIIVADERQRAYVEALNHLARKPRTAKEITQRLQQKGFEPSSVETTLERLEKDKLIDDALYAKMWTEQRMTSHKKGRLWVKQELRQKGIGTELISEALGEISADAELESGLAVGRKKWQQTHGEMLDRKRKTGAYLMRRGFGGDQVRQVLKRLVDEDQEKGEWDDELGDFE
ncbi:RecX family transcriptional regulator [Paenibacillus sp. ISL-20]|uniref:regulatory protein RecX n=1 Tax=Paenibacillus sp. ISL-20 TaxID=2819163 RepID=UPI001BEC5A2A|nr:RecX family transcriptional regulator [Paenibacillus sp. ISL-20]MBT2761106.1 RecX family transcriptional regulator [Paenibacillus sp. ISL-20]